jgi:very-short-patch-repair endonuclease
MGNKGIILHQQVTEQKLAAAKRQRQAMTPAEAILWQALRRNQLAGYHFRRQQVIDGLIADFYCHAAALVVEVDGEIHKQQQAHDQQRDQILTRRNLAILRLPNAAVLADLPAALEQIRRLCDQRTQLPGGT